MKTNALAPLDWLSKSGALRINFDLESARLAILPYISYCAHTRMIKIEHFLKKNLVFEERAYRGSYFSLNGPLPEISSSPNPEVTMVTKQVW